MKEDCGINCSKESCSGCPSAKKPQSFLEEPNIYTNVKKIIGIVSGKGGVGKSFTTASFANALSAGGLHVGIMDADITGPSIPKMYGLHGPASGNNEGIFPAVTENGIKVISMNLLLEDEEAPAVWRGPVIAGMIKQFWTDVLWGDLDFLLIDLPPGTGDVPLTVFQSIPVDGIVVVTSPQELVKMIVNKAVNMAGLMNIPVLGIVENYSWIACPDCGKKIELFGESHIEEIAAKQGMKVLAKIPMMTEYAKIADEGKFAEAVNPYIKEAADWLTSYK